MPSHPFTWNDVVEKFDQLTADRIDSDLANEIKDAVRSLEHIKVSDLMALLARIQAGRHAAGASRRATSGMSAPGPELERDRLSVTSLLPSSAT